MGGINDGRGQLRGDSRDRLLFVVLAQTPLLAVLFILTWVLGTTSLDVLRNTGYLAAFFLAVTATVVALVWVRSETVGRWMALIPLADFAVIAMLRIVLHSGVTPAPALGALLLLPALWLSVEMGPWALPFVVAGAAWVVGGPFVVTAELPTEPTQWINIVLVPLTLAFVALSAVRVTERLKTGQDRADALAERLRTSLAESADREAKLSSVTETVDAAILMLDIEGQVVFNNDAARQLYDRGASAGSPVPAPLELYAQDRTTPVPEEQNIRNRALRGESLRGRIFWVGSGADQRALTAASNRVIRADGQLLGTVVVSHDVTRLIESIEVRDAFLGTVSHELTTPLTNIIGYLDLLDATGNPDEIAVIRKNAERLNAMVGDLLHNASSAPVSRLPGDVAAVATTALADIRPRAQVAGVELVQTGLPSLVAEVDGPGVQRVIGNLLSNAVIYSKPGQSVVLDVGVADGRALITVTDTGTGIDTADADRVFEKFFRGKHSRSQAIPGTGLGLSIAKALVEAHDGTIRVTSSPGAGSTFTVLLPLHSAGAQ